MAQLTDGAHRNLSDIAILNKAELSEVSRILPLAFLSPKLVEAILAGDQPVQLTAQRLSRIADLPLSWANQHAALSS